MPANIVTQEDLINVSFVPLLVFAGPGAWKTTLGQTAETPLTLDFDMGIHRVSNRKHALHSSRKDGGRLAQIGLTWEDCVECTQDGTFDPYDTIVIDTGGRALDSLEQLVIRESPSKNTWQWGGRLSPTGWGELGSRFRSWLNRVKTLGKNLVMLCHQDSQKSLTTGQVEYHPDLQGNMSWKEVHKSFDLIGRIRYDGKKRILDFNPSEESPCCKNAAGFDPIEIPDLHTETDFLAQIMKEAKERMGKTAAASAAVAKAVDEWQAKLDADPTLEQFNAMLPEVGKLSGAAKKQVWALVQRHAQKNDCSFDAVAKKFFKKEVA